MAYEAPWHSARQGFGERHTPVRYLTLTPAYGNPSHILSGTHDIRACNVVTDSGLSDEFIIA